MENLEEVKYIDANGAFFDNNGMLLWQGCDENKIHALNQPQFISHFEEIEKMKRNMESMRLQLQTQIDNSRVMLSNRIDSVEDSIKYERRRIK